MRFAKRSLKLEYFSRSAVPFLLNEDNLKQKKDLTKLLRVNDGVCYATPSCQYLGQNPSMNCKNRLNNLESFD